MKAAAPLDLEERILRAADSTAAPASLREALDRFLPQCTFAVSSRVPTACIRRTANRYRIEFGQDFLQGELQDDRDLLFVLLHEAFHHVLGHLDGLPAWLRAPAMREPANIAADILVNRAVTARFFPGGVPLLGRMYARTHPIGALLRMPDGPARVAKRGLRVSLQRAGIPLDVRLMATRIQRVGWFEQPSFEALAALVRDYLARLGPGRDVFLLGDHTVRRRPVPGLPWDADDGDAFGAGDGFDLEDDETADVVEPSLSPELAQAVRRALTEDPNSPMRRIGFTPVTSPVFSPGRADWPSLALGYWPTLFHGNRLDTTDDDQRAHVYIDVSGSFDVWLSRVYGLVLALGNEVGPAVHLFSNQVADATLDELARGLKRTTGGTDFGCVFAHAIERRYRRILVITDGMADLDAGLAETFTGAGASVYVVLLGFDAGMARMWSVLPEIARGVWEIR